MLQKLLQQAYSVFRGFHTGLTEAGVNTHKLPDRSNSLDELEVLGGRKSVINNSPSTPPASYLGSPPSSSWSLYDSGDDSSLGSQQDHGEPQIANSHSDPSNSDWPVAVYDGAPNVRTYLTGTAASATGMMYPTVEASTPVPSHDDQAIMGPQEFADPGVFEYPHMRQMYVDHRQQPYRDVESLSNFATEYPGSRYPVNPASQHHLTGSLLLEGPSTQMGQQPNQEEIWRVFIRRLGTNP
jgi:hypothetical protein